jgi:RNA polymerase sigma factor (sigma-70 family)
MFTKALQKPVPWRVSYRGAADFLRERYAEVYGWCLQITGNEVQEAEDLIQDAFILLSHAKTSAEDLRNPEGYIYVILRNLHRSRYERERRHIPLEILDYDCARLGLSVTDSSHLLIVADQLRRICEFACERKETSRAGSVLILRFFHGYYPTEIANILVSSRQSVEEYLRAIRKEARDSLARTAKPVLRDVKATAEKATAAVCSRTSTAIQRLEDAGPELAEPPSGQILVPQTTETVLDEFRRQIFASCSSPCPGSSVLAKWYRLEAVSPLPTDLLAHIVSCWRCLSEVNRLLNLAPLNSRDPSDSAGKQSGSGFTVFSRRSSKKGKGAGNDRLKRLDRLAAELFEHRPESLCVAVNGRPVATQSLTGTRSEITVRLQQSTGIDFVEVFSEQDVRLLMLPIRELPPNGPFEQSTVARLSEGRELTATFRHTSPWPSVCVSYSSADVREVAEISTSPSVRSPQLGTERWSWPVWRPTWRWVGASLSLLAMCLYLVEQTRYDTAEARTLVGRCTTWENEVRQPAANVVRQRFDFWERSSPQALHETVEVWRGSGRRSRLAQHLDRAGHVLGTSDRPPLRDTEAQPDRIWQFEPSAESFAAFTRPQERLLVRRHGEASDVEADQITLTLDLLTHRPTAEILRVNGREFEFVETGFDSVPTTDSPLALSAVQPPEHRHAVGAIPTSSAPLLPTKAELELSELQARVALHALRADLQDGVRYRQKPDGVAVEIVVDRDGREKTIAALERVPLVRPRFRVVEDLALTAETASEAPASPPKEEPPRFEPLMEPYLRHQLGSAAAVNEVMAAAARASDDLLHRAVALSELSQRYPAETIAALTPEARLELLRLVQSDLAELEIERRNFQQIVVELVRPVASATIDPGKKDTGENWTASAAELLETAQTLHRFCSSLFVQTTEPPADSLSNLTERVVAIEERLQTEAARLQRNLVAHVGQ